MNARAVLLCSEEDDLELVGLVHAARNLGIELEVVPGIDSDPQRILDATRKSTSEAVVLVCSRHLKPERALEIKSMFDASDDARLFVVIELNPARAEKHAKLIARRIALGPDSATPSVGSAVSVSTAPGSSPSGALRGERTSSLHAAPQFAATSSRQSGSNVSVPVKQKLRGNGAARRWQLLSAMALILLGLLAAGSLPSLGEQVASGNDLIAVATASTSLASDQHHAPLSTKTQASAARSKAPETATVTAAVPADTDNVPRPAVDPRDARVLERLAELVDTESLSQPEVEAAVFLVYADQFEAPCETFTRGLDAVELSGKPRFRELLKKVKVPVSKQSQTTCDGLQKRIAAVLNRPQGNVHGTRRTRRSSRSSAKPRTRTSPSTKRNKKVALPRLTRIDDDLRPMNQ